MSSSITVDLKATDAQMQAVMSRVAGACEAVKSKMENVGRAAAAMLAGGLVGNAINQAVKQDVGLAKFDAALMANGVEAEEWSARLRNAAKGISSVTEHGGGAVREVMIMGLNMGVAADQVENLSRAAVGLSAVTGKALPDSMRALIRAQLGQFEALQEGIPALRAATTEQEKLAIVNEMAAKGWQQAERVGQTASVQFDKFKASLQGLQGTIMSAVIPALTRKAETMRAVLLTVQKWAGAHQELIQKIVATTFAVVSAVAVIPQLIALFRTMAGLAAYLATPLGVAIAAVGGLAAAFAYLAGQGDTFTARLLSGFQAIGQGIDVMFGSWQGFTGSLTQLWNTAVTAIAVTWNDAVAKVQATWGDVVNWMSKKWLEFKNSLFEERLANFLAPIVAKMEGVSTEQVRAGLKEDYTAARKRQPAELAAMDKENAARKKQIEEERVSREKILLDQQAASTKAWEEQKKKLPTFSAAIRDMMARVSKDSGFDDLMKQFADFQKQAAGGGPAALAMNAAAGKEKSPFKASIEDAAGLYRRIAASAATPNKPEDRAAKAAEAHLAVGRQQVDLLKTIAAKKPPAQPSATVKATFGA